MGNVTVGAQLIADAWEKGMFTKEQAQGFAVALGCMHGLFDNGSMGPRPERGPKAEEQRLCALDLLETTWSKE